MSKKISVILLADVPGIGVAGDVINVAEGFARNQLFPEGKAALADSEAGKTAERAKEKEQAKADKDLAAARKLAESLDGTELTLRAKVKEGEGNEIFGSITAKQVAEELSRQTGSSFSAKQVQLEEPIRALGTTAATLILLPDVETQIQITIIDEEA